MVLGSGESVEVNNQFLLGYGGFSGEGILVPQRAADLAGTTSGWASGDYIDLTKIAATLDSYSDGTLSLFGANSDLLGTLNFAGVFSANNFTLTALPGSGTEIGYHS